MALTGSVVLSLTGCAGSVPGRPWPEGQGPAAPAAAPSAGPGVPGGAGPAGPPTSLVVPGPPVPGGTTPPTPEPRRSGAGRPGSGPATRTVPPVAVGPTTEVPDVRPRRPAAAPGLGSGIPGAGDGAPGARATGPAPPVADAPLTADALPDECLVRADALAGLLGTAPAAPASNTEVGRPDGSRARSCFAVGGSVTVSVNVYTTNLTTPAGHLRAAAGSRPLTGTGDGTTAALLETVGGPALQLGTARYLVTIAVAGRTPSDEQWRAAVRSTVATLHH